MSRASERLIDSLLRPPSFSKHLPAAGIRLMLRMVAMVVIACLAVGGIVDASASPSLMTTQLAPTVAAAPAITDQSLHSRISLLQTDHDPEDLMLSDPVGELDVVDDARWSADLTGNSLIAAIWWVVMLVLLLAAGYPWTRIAFRNLSDSGHGLARLTGLLLSVYLVWILASLEIIGFRAVWAAASLVLVGLTGWCLHRRFVLPDHQPQKNRWSWRASEIAFWFVFFFFLTLRWINPDSWHPTWGGEKPMEFAHINAILRSAHFPPYDPWFSDGILNYYYYGEYLIAYLMKLTGIPSEIAFNLAQPTVMALLASGVYSVTSTLAGRMSRDTLHHWVGGAAGVVIVVMLGNLVALQKLWEALPSRPSPSFIEWTWAGSRAITGGITEFPYFTGLYADLHAHVVALPVTVLVIAIALELALRQDLDANGSIWHLTRQGLLPFALAAISLGTLGAANAWDVPLYSVLIAASVFMYFQHDAGSQRFSGQVPVSEENCHPDGGMVSCCSSTSGNRRIWMTVTLRFLNALIPRLALTAISTVAILALAYLLFKPFHDNFVALFSSIDRVRAGTELNQFLLHLGGLIALIAIGLAILLIDRIDNTFAQPARAAWPLLIATIASVAGIVLVWRELPSIDSSTSASIVTALLACLAVAAFIIVRFGRDIASIVAIAAISAVIFFIALRGWNTLALSLALGSIGALLWSTRSPASIRFAGLLIAAGGFAASGVEIVYVVDDLQTLDDFYRMNTVFKIYNEVWITLGLAASVLIGALFLRLLAPDSAPSRESDHIEETDPAHKRPPPLSFVPFAAIAVAVILAGLLYPALATRPRLEERFSGHPGPSTLNALDWMDYGTIQSASDETIAFAEDRDVIDWFNDNVTGTPVIAEASIGPYRGNGSRISIATGLPTVLGWDRHERQQRYQSEINTRLADLLELYNSTDPARKLELLNQYNVEYIIVGEVERTTILEASAGRPYASEAGLAAFESMVGDTLEIAFQSGDTVVYRVLDSR